MAICNELDAGISKTCDNNTGGIKKLYLAELENISSITHGSPLDTITAISMVATKKFYEFVFNKNTSTFTEVTTGDQAVGSEVCTQTITLVLNRREQAKRDVLLKLGKFKDLAAIVLDSNDKYWLLGETEGVNLTEKNSENGTVKTDRNGYTLTFVGEEPEDASEVDSIIIAALL
mgnify:FL=1|nr:hypothetical protein [uncultured Flavobacterium sp.]